MRGRRVPDAESSPIVAVTSHAVTRTIHESDFDATA